MPQKFGPLSALAFALIVLGSCANPSSDSPKDKPAPAPTETRATLQFMNLAYNGDDIETKVLGRYTPVTTFLSGDTGLLGTLAVVDLYPVTSKTSAQRASLRNNFTDSFPDPVGLRAATPPGPGTGQTDMLTWCAQASHRLVWKQAAPEAVARQYIDAQAVIAGLGSAATWATFVSGAERSLKAPVGSDLKTDLDRISQTLNGSGLVPVAVLDDLVTVKVPSTPAKGPTARFAIGSALSIVSSVLKLTGALTSLFGDDTGVKLDAILRNQQVIQDRLSGLEAGLSSLQGRMEALNVQATQLAYKETFTKLSTWLTQCAIKVRNLQLEGTPEAQQILTSYINSIDGQIDVEIQNLITKALTSQQAYFTLLASYSGSDAALLADQKEYVAPLQFQLSGGFAPPYQTRYEYPFPDPLDPMRTYPIPLGGPVDLKAFTGVNPNRYLPTSPEVLDFLGELLTFRLSLLDYLVKSVDARESWRNDEAQAILAGASYLKALRDDLNAGFDAIAVDMAAALALVPSQRARCLAELKAYVYNGIDNFNPLKYSYFDWFWSTNNITIGAFALGVNGKAAGSLATGFSGNWEPILKAYLENEYLLRSDKMLAYAAKLASLEMYLESFVGN